MLRTRLPAVAAVLGALAGPTSAPAAPSAPSGTARGACTPVPGKACKVTGDQILSNETTFTTWASVFTVNPVRESPSTSSPRVTMLHFSTEDGFPEVYIVLRQRQVGSTTWAQVRIPARQGRTGWVPRNDLDTFNRITTELVLNRASQRIRLYRGGSKVLEIPAGIGAPDTPTPPGHYWIREAFPVDGVPAYGPFAFGTSAYSPTLTDWPGGGVIGLHGTNEPGLVPGRPSHGCIRVHNADILRLAHLVSVGTPLLVE